MVIADFGGVENLVVSGELFGSEGKATLKVNKATPDVAWPHAGAIQAGSKLSSSQLTGQTGAGLFEWTDDIIVYETDDYEMTFTPDDAVHYETLTKMIRVEVYQIEAVATPTASPNGGAFTGSVEVTLSSATDGAEIRYTTDGSSPEGSWATYTKPLTFTKTTTLWAYATDPTGELWSSEKAEFIFTKKAETPEEPDRPTWIPSSNDDDDDSDYNPAPIVRPLAPAEKWMTAANLRNPSRETLKFGVRVSAWDALTGAYYHDSVRDNAVEVRTYFDDPSLFTADSYVSGWTTGTDVDKTRTTFKKWFTNKFRVIHFDRAGMWEYPVRVAVRVDLAGFDPAKLVLYAYDPKTGYYRKLAAPATWIDANGYLRFTTEYAGEIIVSEGELEKK